MQIQRVGVVGAGTMGNGIAHVFAKAGFNVILCDVRAALLDRGLATIGKNMDREVAKQKLTADGKCGRHQAHHHHHRPQRTSPHATSSSRPPPKTSISRRSSSAISTAICKPEVILASNTSSISITKLGALTKRPEQVIGMHFFNPVPVMKLVEVIRGLATSDETYATV